MKGKKGINKNLVDENPALADRHGANEPTDITFVFKPMSMRSILKKYLSEKNALTVMVCLFCLVMTVISAVNQSIWEAVAFALATSFSVEVICHRTKENG
jgi:hypothetical protein